MERNLFIINLYTKFIFAYLVISFFVMYIFRYGIIIIQNSIKENELYNPLTTQIVKNELINDTISHIKYYITYYDKNKVLQKSLIQKHQYEKINAVLSKYKTGKIIVFDDKIQINIENILDLSTNENDLKKDIKVETQKITLKENEIINKHFGLIKNVYTDLIFIFFMFMGLIYYIYKKSKLNHLYLLPYDKNIFSTFATKEKTIKQYDYFKKQIVENGILKNYFENKSSSNFDIYKKEEENLIQYFGLNPKEDFLDIERKGKKGVCIYPTPLNKLFLFKKDMLKKGKLFIGYQKGNIPKYLDIKDMTHTIGVGETGSGKSVLENCLLTNFYYSEEMFEKFFLIDFKMVELSIYEKVKKVELITTSKDLLEFIKKIHNEMIERLQEMKQLGLRTSKKPFIFVLTDEFGEIVNNTLEKKEKQEIETLLVDLLQKSRRANFRFFFFGQKRDTKNIYSNVLRNIPTKICLGTENQDNITKIGGTKESLEKIQLSPEYIKKFQNGRGIYRDGKKKDRFLFQRPFFDLDDNDDHRQIWEEIFKIELPPKVEEEKLFENTINMTNIVKPGKIKIELENEVFQDTQKPSETVSQVEEKDIEVLRKHYWEKSKSLNKDKQKEVKSLLFKIKRHIKNNDLQRRNNLLNEVKTHF